MRFIKIVALLLLLTQFALAQNIQKPVSWTLSYKQLTAKEGELIFTAKIDPKWHIYSQRLTDAGPIPTSFSITAQTSKYEKVGVVEEGNAHEEFVPAFEAKLFVFEKEAIFTQKITRKTNDSFVIKTTLEYMTCNDSQCLPPTLVDLDITIPATELKK